MCFVVDVDQKKNVPSHFPHHLMFTEMMRLNHAVYCLHLWWMSVFFCLLGISTDSHYIIYFGNNDVFNSFVLLVLRYKSIYDQNKVVLYCLDTTQTHIKWWFITFVNQTIETNSSSMSSSSSLLRVFFFCFDSFFDCTQCAVKRNRQ